MCFLNDDYDKEGIINFFWKKEEQFKNKCINFERKLGNIKRRIKK